MGQQPQCLFLLPLLLLHKNAAFVISHLFAVSIHFQKHTVFVI